MGFESSCACPFNLGPDRNPCGKRSAYAREKGKARPICYPADVTPEMIRKFRERPAD